MMAVRSFETTWYALILFNSISTINAYELIQCRMGAMPSVRLLDYQAFSLASSRKILSRT